MPITTLRCYWVPQEQRLGSAVEPRLRTLAVLSQGHSGAEPLSSEKGTTQMDFKDFALKMAPAKARDRP